MLFAGRSQYLVIAATTIALYGKVANAATVVSIYSDDQCQTLTQEVHGPNNGSCVNAIKNAAGWMVTSWDDGCLVHMADDKYGDDNLRRCAAITAQAQTAYTKNCYPSSLNFTHYSITNCSSTSSDIALFSIDGSSNTTSSPSDLVFGDAALGSSTDPPSTSSNAPASPASTPADSGTSTSSDNEQNTANNGSKGGLGKSGTIAIGVAVPVVCLIATAAGLWFCLSKRRQKRADRFVGELEPQNRDFPMKLEEPERSNELEEQKKRHELGAKEGTETSREQIQELPDNDRGLKSI